MPPQQQYRGVSLGGWLVFESFITPYLFSLTDCDINGDFYDIEIGNINSPKWGEITFYYFKKVDRKSVV